MATEEQSIGESSYELPSPKLTAATVEKKKPMTAMKPKPKAREVGAKAFVAAITEVSEFQQKVGRNKQVGNSKTKDATTKCLTCHGKGCLLCTEMQEVANGGTTKDTVLDVGVLKVVGPQLLRVDIQIEIKEKAMVTTKHNNEEQHLCVISGSPTTSFGPNTKLCAKQVVPILRGKKYVAPFVPDVLLLRGVFEPFDRGRGPFDILLGFICSRTSQLTLDMKGVLSRNGSYLASMYSALAILKMDGEVRYESSNNSIEKQLIENDGQWLHELALNNLVLEALNFYITDLVKSSFGDLELIARNCHSLLQFMKNSLTIYGLRLCGHGAANPLCDRNLMSACFDIVSKITKLIGFSKKQITKIDSKIF